MSKQQEHRPQPRPRRSRSDGHRPLVRDDSLAPGSIGFDMPDERPSWRSLALDHKRELKIAVPIAFVALVLGVVVYTLGAGHGLTVATDAVSEAKEAQDLAEIYKDSAEDWKLKAEEASATADSLLLELEDEKQRAETYKAYAEEASSTIATLEGQVQQQKATKTTPAAQPTQVSYTNSFTPAEGEHGGVWPESKTAGVLAAAADYYGITGADREFIVAKGCYIIYRGAENRGGICDKLNTGGSGARGLLQYMPSWGTGPCPHGASDWRACGTCSCFAFVKVYRDAGVAGLKRQWAATYGG